MIVTKLHILLKSWLADQKGATAIEYTLIAAAIALTIAGAIAFFGDSVYNLFYTDLGNALPAHGGGSS